VLEFRFSTPSRTAWGESHGEENQRGTEVDVDSGRRRTARGHRGSCNPDEEDSMRYLCLVYIEEAKLNALSTSERAAITNESLDYNEELRRRGHFLAAEALQETAVATTLQIRNGKLSTTDGPFAETKEQLGGFILIEARDLNEALQVGARIPMARLAKIEVRPVRELAKT
jgi:hypothetical protein